MGEAVCIRLPDELPDHNVHTTMIHGLQCNVQWLGVETVDVYQYLARPVEVCASK